MQDKELKDQEPIVYDSHCFYSVDEKVGSMYTLSMTSILNSMYSQYKGKNNRFLNIPGDPHEYSKLNYVASNKKTMSTIINYVNFRIVKAAQDGEPISTRQLDFKEDKSNWVEEMGYFLDIFKYLKYDVLSVDGDKVIFDELIDIIKETTEKGELSEKILLQFIKQVFPLSKNYKTGGEGDVEDIKGGIDMKFTYGGIEKTLQHKRCSSINKAGGTYFINGVAGIKKYNTDYMSFHTSHDELYIFENNDTVQIREYDSKKGYMVKKYQFNAKLFKAEKRIKKRKKR